MIDEYRHLLKGELSYDEESELYAAMMNSMKIHGATYDIDFVDCLKSDGER